MSVELIAAYRDCETTMLPAYTNPLETLHPYIFADCFTSAIEHFKSVAPFSRRLNGLRKIQRPTPEY